MTPRRPIQLLMGSESQQPMNLFCDSQSPFFQEFERSEVTLPGRGRRRHHHLDQRKNLRATNIRTGIDQSDKDFIPRRGRSNAIILREKKISTVGTSLIPTLDCRTNGASRNGQKQLCRQPPLVFDLFQEDILLLLVQGFRAGDGLIVVWVLGNDCALAEQREVFGQLLFGAKGFDAREELGARKSFEGVFELGLEASGGFHVGRGLFDVRAGDAMFGVSRWVLVIRRLGRCCGTKDLRGSPAISVWTVTHG